MTAQLMIVRLITNPNLNPATIFGYLFGFANGGWTILGMAAVDNLEDVIGGHIWIGAMLIAGGVWHTRVEPFPWAKQLLIINADAILAYSLGGLAFMAFVSLCFCGDITRLFILWNSMGAIAWD